MEGIAEMGVEVLREGGVPGENWREKEEMEGGENWSSQASRLSPTRFLLELAAQLNAVCRLRSLRHRIMSMFDPEHQS